MENLTQHIKHGGSGVLQHDFIFFFSLGFLQGSWETRKKHEEISAVRSRDHPWDGRFAVNPKI